jgi:hypothetical protein
MLVEEKKFQNEDGSIGYYESIYDSSNVLQTTYFPENKRLFISFNRGGVYSYNGVSQELYEEFKSAESQGKFFATTIRKYPKKYTFRKEYTLYPNEVKDLKLVVENAINAEEQPENAFDPEDDNLVLRSSATDIYNSLEVRVPIDDNTISFSIEQEEVIKITKEGFYYKGEFVEDTSDVYENFSSWLHMATNKYNSFQTKMDEELHRIQQIKVHTLYEAGQLDVLTKLKDEFRK